MEKFKAPTENIELEIVEFCINILGLDISQFWYDWFTSASKTNATLHINCCSIGMKKFIRENISKLSFVNKIHEVKELNLENYETNDFPIKYTIHFKLNEK